MLSFSDQYILLTTVTSFLFGYQVAVLNTSLALYTLYFNACGDSYTYRCDDASYWESLATSIVFFGATFGALFAGYLLDRGRRLSLLVGHALSMIAAAVCFFAYNFPMLIAGRGLAGVCVGVFCVAAPAFISEMCPVKVRGSRGTMHQLAITLGILGAVALGIFLRQPPEIPDSFYQIPTFERGFIRFMQGLPGLVSLGVFLLTAAVYRSDTPQALLVRGHPNSAMRVLEQIYGEDDETVQDRFQELVDALTDQTKEAADKPGFFQLMRKPGYSYALIVGIMLSVGQQLGGINAFVAQSSSIFASAGIPANLTSRMSTLMAVTNVTMTFPAVFLVDRLGRKPLLLMGVAGQAICLSFVPSAWLLGYSASAIAYASVIAVIGYIFFFAATYGPILWVALFEMYPSDLKSAATGLASSLNWVAGGTVVFLTRWYSGAEYGTLINFTFFAGMCWIWLVFIQCFVKETKGLGRSPYIPGGGRQGERIASSETTRLIREEA